MQIPEDYLWPFAGRRAIVVLFSLIVLTLVVFNLFPGIDIAVSRFFFDPTPCPPGVRFCYRFPLSSDPLLGAVRQVLHGLPLALAVLLLLTILWRVLRGAPVTEPFNRAGLAAVGAYALSAGALVNLFFKVHWGRPRPLVTDLFGGWYPFVPAGRLFDDCVSNCDSFVSGEAAGSFWLVALAALAPRRYRIPALATTLAVACAGSLLRVSFGGHYLSDTILAGLLSLFVFALLATLVRHLLLREREAERLAGNL